jgi:hypothetical protein
MTTKSKFWKIITGDTKTRQVSGASVRIANSKDLSTKLYSKIDKSDNFKISSKDGKIYSVRQLVPTKR